MEKPQMTEKQARQMNYDVHKEVGISVKDDILIAALKTKGYIKKTAVEQAEEMYSNIHRYGGDGPDYGELKKLCRIQHIAIQELKAALDAETL